MSTKLSIGNKNGEVPLIELQSKAVTGRKWTHVKSLVSELKDSEVLIRGRVESIHGVSNNIAFVVVRDAYYTVQCVVSHHMVNFVNHLIRESIIDVQGFVSVPNHPIQTTSQQVEIQVTKIYCVNRPAPTLPSNLEHASPSEPQIEEANKAIIYVSSEVQYMFFAFLRSEGFFGIRKPNLPACIAKPLQHCKPMSISGDVQRVFEIVSVFRANGSLTNRHPCDFTSLHVQMEIKEHYLEIMDVVDRLFVAVFDHLNENCKIKLEAISRHYPFQPLKYLRKTLQLTFEQGVEMLKEAGIEVDPYGDLSTDSKRKLGELVRNKYDTEFFILHRYPLAFRPFYTMPCYNDPEYSNSFDVFIRGEEIMSGAQRVHDPDLLTQRAEKCGIDVSTIATYIDSFKYGAPLHGGFEVVLERVVMLFCNLKNIGIWKDIPLSSSFP